MADIIQVAEQLNSEVTRLNNERSKLEGMLESAKKNFEQAVKAYEVKYGVKLTEETLQQEYNRVYAETKGAVLDLQEQIESIKRGDYKKDVEAVEYDLEPDVEPIRAEVEVKKEPAKRTRKKKAEVVVEEPVAPVVDATPVVEATPVEVAPVVEPTVEPTPVVEPVSAPVEEPKKNTISKKGRKPLSGAALSAAVAASETVKQNPVTLGVGVDDDEVDISNIELNGTFGDKPTKGESPVELPFNFGGFGDFGKQEEPIKEPVKETPVAPETPTFGGFGDFGGFGGFGDLGTEPVKTEEPTPVKEEVPVPEVGFGGFGGFGDFGGFGETPVKSEPVKEEKKEEAPTWGTDLSGFGDFGGFGDLLGGADFKFGE